MENRMFKYYAFISYKREDEKWAKWLQQKLEDYKFPVDIRKKFSITPQFLRPIFRDKTDLNGPVLSSSINSALDDSKYLIVICSPNSAKSEWVNKELEYFIRNRDISYVIPFIVDGTPNAEDSQIDCYPLAMRNISKEKELLGINIHESGKESALVKTISRLTNISYDMLWQRYNRMQKRRKNIIFAISLMVTLIMSVFAITLNRQNRLIRIKNNQLFINQSIAVSDVSNRILANGDTFTAAKLALEVLPADILKPDRPYTSQAELALRNATSTRGGLFYGHTDRIYSANTSHDGKLLVSASSDKTIKIWDTTSGECLKTISSEEKNPRGIEISRDNGIIFSYGLSDTIRVWNIQDENCIQTIDCSIFGNLMGAKFAEDNNHIISSIDNFIVEWCISTGEHRIIRDDIPIEDINTNFASARIGNKYIVIGNHYSRSFVYDLENGKTLYSIFIGNGRMFMSRDEKLIVIIENNDHKNYSSIYIYDTNDGHLINEIRSHKTFSLGDISPNNKQIVTGSNTISHGAKNNQSIDIWDVETGMEIQSFNGHNVGNVIFSPNGEYIVSSTIMDNTIGLWDIAQANTLSNNTLEILFNHTGSQFAYAKGSEVFIVDYDSQNIVKTFSFDSSLNDSQMNHRLKVYNFSDDDQFLFCSIDNESDTGTTHDVTFFVCNILDGSSWEIDSKSSFNQLFDIQSTSDNRYLITTITRPLTKGLYWLIDIGDREVRHRINIIDFKTGEQLRSLEDHTSPIMNTIVSSDNKEVISVSKDGSIRHWDIETGECTKILQEDKGFKSSVVTKDKKYIYTLSEDNTILRWSIATKNKHIISSLEYEVNAIRISNLNKFLLLNDSNLTSILSADTGKVLYTINNASKPVIEISFSYDDKYIIIEGYFGDIFVYNACNGDLVWQLYNKGCNVVCNPVRHEFAFITDTINTTKIVPLQQLINETKQRLSYRKLTQEELQKYYLE
ncbi:MAG: TIR domain-containing protein [Alistipes sp.]|nr:TIR domain-containing protein [Alistipes sp.]